MLYHLSRLLTQYIRWFNIVHYVSFRMLMGLTTGLLLSFLLGSWFLKYSAPFQAHVREDTPDTHLAKNNIPTMGGLFIVVATVISTVLWCNLARPEVWIFLFCLSGFALIGSWDDWCKIHFKKGIKMVHKFWAQLGTALFVVLLWYWFVQPTTELCVPFFKTFTPHLGIFLIPWAIFIIVGTSNAVNLTDGLDGLAMSSLLVNFGTFSVIGYLAGNYLVAGYLYIPTTHTAEIAVIGAILVGTGLGFLWYNTYPAQVFMGDVGSLALGSALALMALMARQELLLAVSGGIFVMETISVILQVIFVKFYGRRLFKIAPIHHHFELLGLHESKITTRCTIVSFLLCLLALITLKVR